MIYSLRSLIPDAHVQTTTPEGFWVGAVCLPSYGGYLKGAWAVLRGRAVAVRWPEPGEFEQACHENGWQVPASRPAVLAILREAELTPQPEVNELVPAWRALSALQPATDDWTRRRNETLDQCADELEAALRSLETGPIP